MTNRSLRRVLLLAPLVAISVACDDDGDAGEPADEPAPATAADSTAPAAATTVDEGGEPEAPMIALTLAGDDAAFTGQATAHVTLYGFDPGYADQSANVIVALEHPVGALPLAIDVMLPPEPEALIDPGDPAHDVARYYFRVAIDLDGDGQLCDGEYLENFGGEGPTFFGLHELSELTIGMQVVANYGCSELG